MADKEANVKIKATTEGKEQIEAMAKQMDALGQQVVKTSETFGSLLKKDLWSAFKTELGSAISEAEKFARIFGEKGTVAIEGMQKASGNLISAFDLLKARTRLTTGDFQATEAQMNALAAAAVTLARRLKIDKVEALNMLTDALVGGRGAEKALRQLGIQVELTGTEADKTSQALAVLQNNFAGVEQKAKNGKEAMDAARLSLNQYYGEVLIAIKNTEMFKTMTAGLSSGFRDLSLMLKDASSNSQILAQQFRAIAMAMNLIGAGKNGSLAGGGGMGWGSIGQSFENLANAVALTGVTQGAPPAAKTAAGIDVNDPRAAMIAGWSGLSFPKAKAGVGGRKAGAGVDQRGLGLDFSDETLTDIERFEKMTKLAFEMGKADEEARKLAASLGEEIENSQRMQQYVEPEIRKNVVILDRWQTAVKGIGDSFTDLARGGFADFTQGLTEVAAASILAGDGFAAGMGKMLGATLSSVGRMAAAKAAFYWWEAIASVFLAPQAAPSLFAAAVGMTSLALGLQVAGGALSGVGSGGGGAASGRGAAIAQDTELNQGFRPTSSASSQRNDNRPIVVNVIFDRSDPSAEAFANRRFRQIVTGP